MTKFKKLFEPIQLGDIKLTNRIIMSAVTTHFITDDGYVTDQLIDFYEERARGGAGLIIVDSSVVQSPIGKPSRKMMGIDDDKFIPGLSELAQVIKKYGTRAAIQLQHGGRETDLSYTGGLQPVSASPIASWSARIVPRELTIDEIKEITRCYAAAAQRAKKAGFEAIEINGHGGYLVHQFLSGSSNKRQDAYGGSVENRARFLVEIIKAIKETNGKDFPVWCRIVGRDYGLDDGITIDQSRQIAQMVEKAGANAVHVTVYGAGVQSRRVFPDTPGTLVPLAEQIKKVVSIPVITHGRMSPELGEKVLQEGKADIIAMGRPLLADPELPNKVAAGRLNDIRPCTACLTCQDNILSRGKDIACRVNAAVGRESEYKIKPAEKSKRVLVVGGGPAGMEAARVAALRGHKVLLYEKQHRLGGQAVVASVIHHELDYKDDIEGIIRYLGNQVRQLGVEVNLGKELNPALIAELKPDVIILAIGSVPVTPEIQGIKSGNVMKYQQIQSQVNLGLRFLSPAAVAWFTRFWLPFGKRVVVIGGGIAGCQLAGFLVKRGRKVTITETAQKFAADMVRMYRRILFDALAKAGTVMLAGVKYEQITGKKLIITDKEGKRAALEADTFMPVVGNLPNRELFEALDGKVPELYLIGDCNEPHLIVEAIHDGARIARAI